MSPIVFSDGSSLRRKWDVVSQLPLQVQVSQAVPLLQTLISGLIPPPCVYSGRLKSRRPPPLSPNLQRNPLGLKALPHEEGRAMGEGEGLAWEIGQELCFI